MKIAIIICLVIPGIILINMGDKKYATTGFRFDLPNLKQLLGAALIFSAIIVVIVFGILSLVS